ncbi:hypothetical protein K439DRAFT_1659432 [Ramaria rubella]|nr:hypothetical protein K439DRAFT_1659432 [Ramaria rubella]
MRSTATALLCTLLPLLAFADPHAYSNVHHARSHRARSAVSRSLERRSDRATYFAVGLGACGGTNVGSDFVFAISVDDWDNGAHCYKMATINYQGQSVQGQVVDEALHGLWLRPNRPLHRPLLRALRLRPRRRRPPSRLVLRRRRTAPPPLLPSTPTPTIPIPSKVPAPKPTPTSTSSAWTPPATSSTTSSAASSSSSSSSSASTSSSGSSSSTSASTSTTGSAYAPAQTSSPSAGQGNLAIMESLVARLGQFVLDAAQ